MEVVWERPRYRPLARSSSQWAEQAAHSHESNPSDATKSRATSYELQNGHWRRPPATWFAGSFARFLGALPTLRRIPRPHAYVA